jgi:hypothetical protein
MHARVHEQAEIIKFNEPGTGPDVRIWIQINDAHEKSSGKQEKISPQKAVPGRLKNTPKPL